MELKHTKTSANSISEKICFIHKNFSLFTVLMLISLIFVMPCMSTAQDTDTRNIDNTYADWLEYETLLEYGMTVKVLSQEQIEISVLINAVTSDDSLIAVTDKINSNRKEHYPEVQMLVDVTAPENGVDERAASSDAITLIKSVSGFGLKHSRYDVWYSEYSYRSDAMACFVNVEYGEYSVYTYSNSSWNYGDNATDTFSITGYGSSDYRNCGGIALDTSNKVDVIMYFYEID
ncbi:secreted protein [Candidatus Magnetoovum chiemensis]|nr:secreted protein [Candidatus Magnetoovum chiemensis]